MRTTLNIEDDVLQAARELAQREGGTAGQIISALARRGLAAPSIPPTKRTTTRGGVPLLPSRGDLITLQHIHNLMDEEGV